MPDISVRYIVDDVDRAAAFYRDRLGFQIAAQPGPGFAILLRGPLRLLLSAPSGSGGAAQPAADGRRPEPGGWNRIQIEVEDIEAEVDALARRARRRAATSSADAVARRSWSRIPPATRSSCSSRPSIYAAMAPLQRRDLVGRRLSVVLHRQAALRGRARASSPRDEVEVDVAQLRARPGRAGASREHRPPSTSPPSTA